MSNFTKGKWKVFKRFDELYIYSNGRCIADIPHTGSMSDEEEREANARRIVQCVNNYDDLLEACRKSQTILENLLGEWVAVKETFAPEWTQPLKECCDILKQAIAQVEGSV